jgi:hypothetical protein
MNKNHSFARFSLALRSPQLQFGGDPGECWDQLEESDAIPQKNGSQ